MEGLFVALTISSTIPSAGRGLLIVYGIFILKFASFF
jgi:hypothetical protein